MRDVTFDRAGLLEAFGALGRLAWGEGKTIDIAVYGGSALILSYDWRIATKDVDGVFEHEGAPVRALAALVAKERDTPGLRVFVARPEYLFAVKCRAMRVGGIDENSDIDDIRNLAREIGLADAAEALALVASFYPRGLLQPEMQFGIEEIFASLADDAASGPGK